MPVVRSIFQPDTDLDVSEAEAEVLRRQGLLADTPPPLPPTRPAPKPEPATVTTEPEGSDTKKGKD